MDIQSLISDHIYMDKKLNRDSKELFFKDLKIEMFSIFMRCIAKYDRTNFVIKCIENEEEFIFHSLNLLAKLSGFFELKQFELNIILENEYIVTSKKEFNALIDMFFYFECHKVPDFYFKKYCPLGQSSF